MGKLILGAVIALTTVWCEGRRRQRDYVRWEQAYWRGFAEEMKAARGG